MKSTTWWYLEVNYFLLNEPNFHLSSAILSFPHELPLFFPLILLCQWYQNLCMKTHNFHFDREKCKLSDSAIVKCVLSIPSQAVENVQSPHWVGISLLLSKDLWCLEIVVSWLWSFIETTLLYWDSRTQTHGHHHLNGERIISDMFQTLGDQLLSWCLIYKVNKTSFLITNGYI